METFIPFRVTTLQGPLVNGIHPMNTLISLLSSTQQGDMWTLSTLYHEDTIQSLFYAVDQPKAALCPHGARAYPGSGRTRIIHGARVQLLVFFCEKLWGKNVRTCSVSFSRGVGDGATCASCQVTTRTCLGRPGHVVWKDPRTPWSDSQAWPQRMGPKILQLCDHNTCRTSVLAS